MKTSNPSHQFLLRYLAALILLGAAHWAAGAPTTWTGANLAITNGWSDGGNWDTALSPTPADPVIFANSGSGTTNVAGAVNNAVDITTTILSLSNLTTSPNGFHTTLIPSGVSLNVVGSGGNALWVGGGIPLAVGTETVNGRFVGGGTLAITNGTGIINVVNTSLVNNDHRATLDLSGLTNFSANASQVIVAGTTITSQGYLMGTILLGETNFIRTAAGTTKPAVIVGSMNNTTTGKRGTQQLLLGKDNMFHTDTISIGGTKMDGQMSFRTGLTGGTATFRGSAGGADRVKLFVVADQRAGLNDYVAASTGTGNNGTFDSTGNSVDMLITDLYVARSQTNAAGTTIGTFTFDQGTIDANNVLVGAHMIPPVAAAQSFNATGTLNVNGTAILTVNNDLVLSRKFGTTIPVGTLNIAGNGTVNVKGNIISSNGLSTINFNNGGKIDMQSAGDATPGNVTVAILTGNGGMITNANSVTNFFLLNPGTAATAGTVRVHAGSLVLSNTMPTYFNLTNDTTAGGGVNDLVSVTGTGNLTLSSNFVLVIPTATALANGSYRLFEHTGTRTGFLGFTNSSRYNVSLSYPANQINLNVSGSSGSVRWNSANNALWDLTTSNWFNTGTAATDRYFQLDNVLVDDLGVYTNQLMLSSQNFPGSVTVNSSTRNYTIGGAGRISGATGITKTGSSLLTITTVNDFAGPLVVSDGFLRLGNVSAWGSAVGGTYVTNAGTYDINGVALNGSAEVLYIGGNGQSSTGAVINTGVSQTSALRNISLVDNAAIGAYGGNSWQMRGAGGSGSFSGDLNLYGFTLTKVGDGPVTITDCTVTNSGNMVIQGGQFGFARSLVTGPGTIDAQSNLLSFASSTVGYCTKPIIISGGTIRMGSAPAGTFVLGSPITNLTGATFETTTTGETFTVTNVIVGAGAVTKTGTGILALHAASTYTGPTTISVGALVLSNTASIANTPSITVASGATFDVSAAGITLSSGQTLAGSGTVIGNVDASSGNKITPGTSPGTLTINGNLIQDSATNTFELANDPTQIGLGINDLIQANGNLTLNGVSAVKIVPLAVLNNVTPYTLFQYTGARTGGAANLDVSSDSRYAFTVVDPDTTPGQIQVLVSGSGASANLVWQGGFLGSPTLWDTKVTSNWLNGASSDKFFLGDNVVFDDTAVTNLVTLVGTVQPASVVMSNSAINYTFEGTGGLTAGTLTNYGPGTLSFSNSAANLVGAGATIEGGSVTLANAGGNTFGSGAVVNAGTLNIVNTGPNSFSLPLTVNGGSVIFNQPGTVNFNSQLADNGGGLGTVQKLAGNTLTLAADNSLYNGSILVSAGTLRAGNANCLGTAVGGTTVASGATFDINGHALYNTDVITISGTGATGLGAIVNGGGQQLNAIKGITLAADAAIGTSGNRWDLRGPGGSGSFSGSLNMNGNKLTKLGSGNIIIVDAVVSNPGIIDVLAGTLSWARCSVPADAPGQVILYSNLMVFDNYTVGNFAMPVTVDGGTIRDTGGDQIGFTSYITNLAGGLTLDNSTSAAFNVDGTITGIGALQKAGTGVVVLSAADSTWGGSTIISAGTLQIGTGANNGSLADVPIGNNGVLLVNSLNNFTNNNLITGTGGIQLMSPSGMLMLTASNNYTGQTSIDDGVNAATPSSAIIRISNGYALGTTDGITFIAGGSLDASRLELTGDITVPEPLQLRGRGATVSDTPHISNVEGTNTLTGPLVGTTGGNYYNVSSDAGKLTVAGSFVPPSTAATRQLNLMGAAVGEWSGIISNSTSGTVPATLNKTNSGTWVLSGTNVYFGTTTVSEGTLALRATGSISNTPSINVMAGATFDVSAVSGGFVLGAAQTLEGNGSVVGNVTADGTVSPGASVGALTFANNLVLAGTTFMEIDRNGGSPNFTNDVIVANVLTYGGTLTITNVGAALQSGDTFDLFTWTTRGGSFTATNLPVLNPGLGWDLANLETSGTIAVVTTTSLDPTNLTFGVTGNTLGISWPASHLGWRLESNAVSVVSPASWFEVPGSTATNEVFFTIPFNTNVFFRMGFTVP